MPQSTATTVRLPDRLREAVDQYCEETGLSFNSLVAVAVSDYLYFRARRRPVTVRVDQIGQLQALTSQRYTVKPKPTPSQYQQKIGRNEPCPCGSGLKYKRCCGTKLTD